MKKVQIIGKISGLDPVQYTLNFNESENKLRQLGYVVVNPTRIVPPDAEYADAMRICLRSLCDVDAVALQPDWNISAGAHLEHCVAEALNLQIIRL